MLAYPSRLCHAHFGRVGRRPSDPDAPVRRPHGVHCPTQRRTRSGRLRASASTNALSRYPGRLCQGRLSRPTTTTSTVVVVVVLLRLVGRRFAKNLPRHPRGQDGRRRTAPCGRGECRRHVEPRRRRRRPRTLDRSSCATLGQCASAAYVKR